MNSRRSLMIGASGLAINVVLASTVFLVPGQAYANCLNASSGTTSITNSSDSCVTWTGGNITITGPGVLASTNTAISLGAFSVGSLSNSGSISGISHALENNGGSISALSNSGIILSTNADAIGNQSGSSIGTITNDGSITGSNTHAGISNSGSISTIINNGTIAGGWAVWNYSGSISSLTNNGLMSGVSSAVIMNNGGGTIGTITNSGTITSNSNGIVNFSNTIGTITNNAGGLISGFNAINNVGSNIGVINNAGTISGHSNGIWSQNGFIGTITNTGTIIAKTQTAISGWGDVNTITNEGLITGVNDIYGAGSIGTIYNSSTGVINGINHNIYDAGAIAFIDNAGTIEGNGYFVVTSGSAILGGGPTAILNTGTITGAISNGGTISGNIITDQNLTLVGMGGTLIGGTITTNNHDLLFGSGANQLLAENINVGASNTVSVSGTLRLNTVQSITGNYTETQTGVLNIGVASSSTYGVLDVSGNANLADQGVSFVATSGSLSLGESFTIVQASDAGSTYTDVYGVANGFEVGFSSINSSGQELLVATLNSCSTSSISSTTTVNSNVCGITWTGGTITIASNVAVAGSNVGIANSANTVGDLTNNGAINGLNTGITNTGTIGTVTNNGALTGTTYGINNAGVITLITNSNLIGGNTGINNSGTIGAITNGGLITGGAATGAAYGIQNTGSIGVIANNGTINGVGVVGIFNNGGSIGTINNSGAIIGGRAGGINLTDATIGTIINNAGGTISGLVSSGSSQANGIINNGGSISTLTNAGVIYGNDGIGNNNATIDAINNTSGGSISGSAVGISNSSGTIGSIMNSGVIEGPTAILSTGTILSALSNAGIIEGNINVAQALTITGGTIGSLGTLTGYNGTIATITTNNNDLTFDANAYQLMDDDISVGTSNTVFNNGTIQINTSHSITGNYTQGSGGTLVVGVTNPTHYGQLIVSGAATMINGQVLITPTSGSLTNGETFTIVEASSTGTNYTGVAATASGFTVTASSITSGGNEDLILSLSNGTSGGGGNSGGTPAPTTYMGIGQQTGGANGAAVGTALDQIAATIANGSDASFASILSALNTIGAEQGSVAEGNAIKQLAPGQLSAGVTGNNFTASQSMMVIGQHQQNLHSGGEGFGRSSGSEYTSGALWMQVDGGFANSTAAGAGFHQSYYGLTFGIDDHLSSNAVLGMAFGWAHNGAQGSNSLSGDTVTTSTPELMGYGTYKMGRAYVDAMVGVGYNMFNQNRAISFLNSVATSSYGGMQYMGDVETGYDIPVTPRTTLTPLIGFSATRTDTNSYTESGAGAADTSVGRQIIDSYATSLGGRVSTAIPTAWGALLPDIKLAWSHDLNGSPISSSATLQGVNFSTSTPRAAQDGAEISLGATLQQSDALSLRAEYDGDIRTDYQSHTGVLKGEWKF